MSKDLVKAAIAWKGEEFNAGIPEQCMAFVRHVLTEAEHPLAERITNNPVDGHWTGRNLASSLAGRDLGYPVVSRIEDLTAPAIVFFNDTYKVPGFGPNTITHVGIYVGNGYMVHRPTMAAPVRYERVADYYPGKFRCGLLLAGKPSDPKPPAPAPEPNVNRYKIFGGPEKTTIFNNGQPTSGGRVEVSYKDGQRTVTIDGKPIKATHVTVEIVH